MTCRKCQSPMLSSKALLQTVRGSGDFGESDIVTLSPGGPGKLVDRLVGVFVRVRPLLIGPQFVCVGL